MPARYLRHGSQPEDEPAIHGAPQLEPFWAAGFSFARGHFTVRVPYDAYQPMVFQVGPFVSIDFLYIACLAVSSPSFSSSMFFCYSFFLHLLYSFSSSVSQRVLLLLLSSYRGKKLPLEFVDSLLVMIIMLLILL